MKKILYFLKTEARLLKKSIILISCILTLFVGVFTGVLSVRMDAVNGMYSVLDEVSTEYRLSTQSDGDGGMARELMSDGLVFGYSEGITVKTTMYSDRTSIDLPYYGEINGWEGEINDWTGYHHWEGTLVVLNDYALSVFDMHEDAVISGHWPDGNDQILLEKIIAYFLEVEVGDRVTIQGHDYTLCGIYDKLMLSEKTFMNTILDTYYYVTDSRTVNYEYTYAMFSSTSSAHACYKRLIGSGFSVSVYHDMGTYAKDDAHMYFEILQPVQLALDAIAVLVLAVTVIALYTLMTVFYRQRKKFICQLKLLGAGNGTILGIYLGLAIAMLLVVTVLGSLLGILFNTFFLNFFRLIFQLNFKATFNVLVPIISFVILAALTAALYALAGRKIRSDIIAQEIKAE